MIGINQGRPQRIKLSAKVERPLHGISINGAGSTLDAKVKFLSRPDAYRPTPGAVVCRETHMSWVFLVGDRVYKLKKPVRFPYLDFSSLARREAACRAELRLNRALAPDIYLDVSPLVDTGKGLSIGGAGVPVDWLVVMKRLDESDMLDCLIAEQRVDAVKLERLVAVLAQFYRRATPVLLSPAIHLSIGSAALPITGASCSILVSAFPPAWCGVSIMRSAGFWIGTAASLPLAFAIAGSSQAMATCAPSIFGWAMRSGSSTVSNSIRGFGWSTRSMRSPISVWSASGSVRLGLAPLSNAA